MFLQIIDLLLTFNINDFLSAFSQHHFIHYYYEDNFDVPFDVLLLPISKCIFLETKKKVFFPLLLCRVEGSIVLHIRLQIREYILQHISYIYIQNCKMEKSIEKEL